MALSRAADDYEITRRAWRLIVGAFMLVMLGCASGRFGVIQVRLPAETRSGIVDVTLVDVESSRAVAMVQGILREHGLTPADPSQPYHDSGVMVPMQAFTHPGTLAGTAPDVNRGSSWVLVISKPHDIPDKLVCTIEPPASGNILEVLVKLEYSGSKSTPLAVSLYEDLIHRLSERYGSERVSATKM